MSNKNIKLEKVENLQHIKDPDHQTIYVDKLSSLAMGANVARLSFGLEEPHLQKLNEKLTLIMPTASLLEMIEILTQSLENPGLKSNLLQEIERFKLKL